MLCLPRPQVIFTHESDLDGLVSGVLLQRLARKIFDVEVPIEAHHYHTWRQREPRESAAWVCDLSFEARLDKPNWVIFDHHATDLSPKKAQLVHDLTKSAGLICYLQCQDHEIKSPELDRLVHLNNVADLFLEEDPDFVSANDYANLVKVYGFWNILSVLRGRIEDLLGHPLLEVMRVKRQIEDPIGFEWSRQNVQALSPSVGYVETVLGNNNLIVHQLLEQKCTPYSILLTLFRRSNGVIIASLRSRNGEALKLAEKLQGGGHANAAGASMPKSVRNIPEALAYLRQVLNPAPRKDTPLNNLESIFAAIESKER